MVDDRGANISETPKVEWDVPPTRRRTASFAGAQSRGSRASRGSVASDAMSLLLRPAGLSGEEQQHRQTSAAGAVMVVLNTVIGGGISLVAIPYAARCMGLLPFLVCLGLLAVLTTFSMHLLAVVSIDLQLFNYQDLLVAVIGTWAGKITSLMIFLNNYGVVVAFMQTELDMINAFIGDEMWSKIALAIAVVFVTPVCCFAHVDRLEIAATVAALLCFLFCGIMVANFIDDAAHGTISDNWEWSEKPSRWFLSKGLPSINLSWTCQFNAVPLFGSLQSRTVKTIDRVSLASCVAAMLLYSAFGVALYLSFGKSLEDDVMVNIDPDASSSGSGFIFPKSAALVTEGVLGVAILATIPLFLIEARNMLHRTVLPDDADKHTRIWQTMLMLCCAYGIAVSGAQLSLVLAFVGVLPANVIAWLLPGVAALAWRRGRGLRTSAEVDDMTDEEGQSPMQSPQVTKAFIPLPPQEAAPRGSPWLDVLAWVCIVNCVVCVPCGIVSIVKG